MGRRSLGPEFYEKLVEAYRGHAGEHKHAAAVAGCSVPTAAKIWRQGLAGVGGPIGLLFTELTRAALTGSSYTNDVLYGVKEEGLFAKAEREIYCANKLVVAEVVAKERVDKLLHDARLDAADTMAREAALSRSARACAEKIHELADRIFEPKHVDLIVQLVEKALQGDLEPKEAGNLLRSLASFAKEANAVTKLALELERLRVGEPTEIVKVEVENMSKDEALSVIEDAADLAELVREVEQPVIN